MRIPLFFAAALALETLVTCTRAKDGADAPLSSPRAAGGALLDAPLAVAPRDVGSADAAAASALEPRAAPHEAPIDARDVLFPAADDPPPASCGDAGAEVARCLLEARYANDSRAQNVAIDLFERTGDVAGVERAQIMNGGYRGMLKLVPALPVGAERVHLERLAAALLDYQRFFAALAPDHPGNDAGAAPHPRYRVAPIAIRFFRSVKARTPSAYAIDWTVAYNVDGSLNGNADAVRETLFHEIFHLNDAAHGEHDDDWSHAALGPLYGRIVARCGASTSCLAPYAPNATQVRGGTYYAFQPGNDEREYAAELAIRYYREQRGMLGQGPRVTPPFKCGKAENASAWSALVDEFFAGIDRVPPCP